MAHLFIHQDLADSLQDLTASMLALCVMSGRQKSAEALTADIAAVRWLA